MSASKYPEHDKLKEAKKTKDATQLIGDFLAWLAHNGFVLAKDCSTEHLCMTCGPVPRDECKYSSADMTRWHKYGPCEDGKNTVEYIPGGLYPAGQRTEKLIAGFFEIDERKLEEEKRAMLDALRAMNSEGP